MTPAWYVQIRRLAFATAYDRRYPGKIADVRFRLGKVQIHFRSADGGVADEGVAVSSRIDREDLVRELLRYSKTLS